MIYIYIYIWRSVIFNKSIKINSPPLVFLSLNKANDPELSAHADICCNSISFLLIPLLVLDIQ